MSGVVQESIAIEKGLFGVSPTESIFGSTPKGPPPAQGLSPAPTTAESTASAQGRSSAEERRRRRQRLQAGGALGVANTSEARLGI